MSKSVDQNLGELDLRAAQDELHVLGEALKEMRVLLRTETNLHARKLIFDHAVHIMKEIEVLERQVQGTDVDLQTA